MAAASSSWDDTDTVQANAEPQEDPAASPSSDVAATCPEQQEPTYSSLSESAAVEASVKSLPASGVRKEEVGVPKFAFIAYQH